MAAGLLSASAPGWRAQAATIRSPACERETGTGQSGRPGTLLNPPARCKPSSSFHASLCVISSHLRLALGPLRCGLGGGMLRAPAGFEVHLAWCIDCAGARAEKAQSNHVQAAGAASSQQNVGRTNTGKISSAQPTARQSIKDKQGRVHGLREGWLYRQQRSQFCIMSGCIIIMQGACNTAPWSELPAILSTINLVSLL